ncbi:metal-dependent hydrolase [Halopiger aswanensis]|uniref:LexA-binding, inner membrane-associated hydrolase n=1 Tax=Halopiger aswanensis TaxID=148449 RepID=A0A3R7HJS2_9EURY|nr:metal-dependent hydrolase [Halopiger aswanensis]RKD97187.1 hypothetical protein ATJ93_0169 [Halopiger aswanensis]
MMATTHALMGVALVALVFPEVGAAPTAGVLLAAFVGGIVPDLDMGAAHRKTLHFPVCLPLAAAFVGGGLLASGATGSLALGLFAFLLSAALHSAIDVFGGGVEPEPWKRTSNKAVYNHVLGRWHRPKRWVRYAGAPEDFLLAAVCGTVAIRAAATTPEIDRLLLGTLAFSAAFTLVRKRIPDLLSYANASLSYSRS